MDFTIPANDKVKIKDKYVDLAGEINKLVNSRVILIVNTVGALVMVHKSLGLVSLFNGISTLFRFFNAEAILLEEQ